MFSLFFSLLVNGVLLTDDRKNILQKNIVELQSDLKSGKLKPKEVLQAYQAKVIVFVHFGISISNFLYFVQNICS